MGGLADISAAGPENPGQIGALESLRGGLQRAVPELLGQGGLLAGSRQNGGGADAQNIADVALGDHVVGYDDKHALDYIAQFPLLSNCATIVNFLTMWLCTGILFAPLRGQPFQFLFFDYTHVENDLGLCGFLSFLVATTAAQAVNFFVQKNLVFRSNAQFRQALPKYICWQLCWF